MFLAWDLHDQNSRFCCSGCARLPLSSGVSMQSSLFFLRSLCDRYRRRSCSRWWRLHELQQRLNFPVAARTSDLRPWTEEASERSKTLWSAWTLKGIYQLDLVSSVLTCLWGFWACLQRLNKGKNGRAAVIVYSVIFDSIKLTLSILLLFVF